jgi:hypothetical protein
LGAGQADSPPRDTAHLCRLGLRSGGYDHGSTAAAMNSAEQAGLRLAVYIVLAGYDDHLPFYWLEQIFRERQSFANAMELRFEGHSLVQWVEPIAWWLQPLYDAMWAGMKAGG